jgi:hypothetical protein
MGLLRSPRLKRDLEYLLELHPTDLEVLLAKYPGDKVADFCTHIRKSVHEKPWTLVAYAWCFYMAVFSGGRWIRAGLLNAGDGFWPNTEEGVDVALQDHGLSFWHFPGAYDGEDIKAEFKLRLEEAEHVFSDDQRIDIIEEAKSIFQLCAGLVYELDAKVGSPPAAVPLSLSPQAQASTETLAEKQSHVDSRISYNLVPSSAKSWTALLRRREIAGSLIALGCLVCVALLPNMDVNLSQDW